MSEEMPPPVFYLIHFDQFISSNSYFFRKNPLSRIMASPELRFVQNIWEFQKKAVGRGYLINLRGDSQNNTILSYRGLGQDYLFPGIASALTIFDDLYRDSECSVNPFEESLLLFYERYQSETGADITDAMHVFSGYASTDCVPSVMQALSEGKGYSALTLEGYMAISYSGKKIPYSKMAFAEGCVYPFAGMIDINRPNVPYINPIKRLNLNKI